MAAIGCCKLLGARILRSCICPCRSSHSVPINLQDKCYSLLWNFLHLFEWENVISLRVRALAILYISGYRQHSFCCGLVAKLCLTLGPWAHFQANGPVLLSSSSYCSLHGNRNSEWFRQLSQSCFFKRLQMFKQGVLEPEAWYFMLIGVPFIVPKGK